MKRLSAAVMMCCAMPCVAKDQLLLLTPVTYTPDASVIQRIREECNLEGMLERDVSNALKKRFSAGTVDSEAAANGIPVLKVQISYVFGVGGGSWTGPKSLVVHADLIEDGNSVRHARIRRSTNGGPGAIFKGTCSILERCSVAIAKDLTRWAADASYKVEDEVPPKEEGNDTTALQEAT